MQKKSLNRYMCAIKIDMRKKLPYSKHAMYIANSRSNATNDIDSKTNAVSVNERVISSILLSDPIFN